MTALYIIAAIIALIIILFLVHIHCKLSFSYSEDGTDAVLTVRYLFLRFKLYPKETAGKEGAKQKERRKPKVNLKFPKSFERFSEILSLLKDALSRILSYIVKHFIKLDTLNVSAVIGTDEAMKTGMAVGAANAAAYSIIAYMQRNMGLKTYNADISGDFNGKSLKIGVYLDMYTNVTRALALAGIIIKFAVKAALIWRTNKNGKSGNRNA